MALFFVATCSEKVNCEKNTANLLVAVIRKTFEKYLYISSFSVYINFEVISLGNNTAFDKSLEVTNVSEIKNAQTYFKTIRKALMCAGSGFVIIDTQNQ